MNNSSHDADSGAGDALADFAQLTGAGRFRRVRRFVEIDSTNRYLADLARSGVGIADGLVVVADHQSQGRGRLGRRWRDVAGNSLMASVLVDAAAIATKSLPLLSLGAGVALADALEAMASLRTSVKWPNDVLWGGRKLAGVLAEAVGGSDGISAVVVGLGVNLRLDGLPEDVATGATSLAEAGVELDPDGLLLEFLRAFTIIVEHLEAGHARRVIDAVSIRCETLGRRVSVSTPAETISGTATEIGGDGSLVVAGRRITVGDVVHVTPGG